MAIRNTFKVYERLKKEQHINTLFLKGKAYSVFPLRVIWLSTPRLQTTDSPVLAGFSIPKKKFGSSVHRHRIRRLIVEAWRLNKATLYPHVPADVQVHLFFIYTDKQMPEFAQIEHVVKEAINKLKQIISVPGAGTAAQ